MIKAYRRILVPLVYLWFAGVVSFKFSSLQRSLHDNCRAVCAEFESCKAYCFDHDCEEPCHLADKHCHCPRLSTDSCEAFCDSAHDCEEVCEHHHPGCKDLCERKQMLCACDHHTMERCKDYCLEELDEEETSLGTHCRGVCRKARHGIPFREHDCGVFCVSGADCHDICDDTHHEDRCEDLCEIQIEKCGCEEHTIEECRGECQSKSCEIHCVNTLGAAIYEKGDDCVRLCLHAEDCFSHCSDEICEEECELQIENCQCSENHWQIPRTVNHMDDCPTLCNEHDCSHLCEDFHIHHCEDLCKLKLKRCGCDEDIIEECESVCEHSDDEHGCMKRCQYFFPMNYQTWTSSADDWNRRDHED